MINTAKRIVIKVGSSTLTYPTGMLNIRKIELLVKYICDLQNSGRQFILVSSGAVSAGVGKLGLGFNGLNIEDKQAAAAVGQCELMNMYSKYFSEYGHTVAQVLLTKDVIDNESRREHAKSTFNKLLDMKCIPIVNENDTVSSEEIKFGGNDTLSAVVGWLTDADLVINMSDVDGLFDSDPRKNPNAKLITTVKEIDSQLLKGATLDGSGRGIGGMRAKLIAAQMCQSVGIMMIIVNGAMPSILYDIFNNEFKGTCFIPNEIVASQMTWSSI